MVLNTELKVSWRWKYLIMIFWLFVHSFDVCSPPAAPIYLISRWRRAFPGPQTATDWLTKLMSLFLLFSNVVSISYSFVFSLSFVCVCPSLQEIMMDHALRTISYIADIGDLVVLMARRRMITQDGEDSSNKIAKTPKMVCHVFESEEVTNVWWLRYSKWFAIAL